MESFHRRDGYGKAGRRTRMKSLHSAA
jgi:hypothetical protein